MTTTNPEFEETYFSSYGEKAGRGQYRDAVLKRTFRTRFLRRFVARGDLLELGCAYGFLLRALERDFDCEGVDISAHAIEVARKVTRAQVEQQDVIEAVAAREGDSYDVVAAFDVLEHLDREKLPDFVADIARVLRPGGFLILSVPNRKSVGRSIKGDTWHGYRDPTHISLLEPIEWKEMVNRHLKVVATGGDGLWDAPYLPFLPRVVQLPLVVPMQIAATASAGRFPSRFSENLLLACMK